MTTCIVKGVTFVVIPKNASSTIRHWLNVNYLHQITYGNCSSMHASLPMIENATNVTCAVVRNPWDRIVSAWAYDQKNPFRMFPFPVKKEKLSFDEFVRKLETLKLSDQMWFTWATPQVDWIPNGVTYLLRFENLSEDFRVIQDLFGCQAPLSHENKTEHEDYRSYYTDETRAIVAELFKKDIEAFGYEF